MRICLICTEKLPVPPIRGGAIQTYIAGIAPLLSRQHAVTVVCREDPDLPDTEERGPIQYKRVPAPTPLDYCRNVAAFLRVERFDLVEVFNRPAFVPELAEAAGAARFVLSMHNDMFDPARLPSATARGVLERVQAVVTVSDYIRRTIDGQHPGFAGKMRTIYAGVDTAAYQPAAAMAEKRKEVRGRLGLAEGPVVLHVSRISPKKGNDVVVKAMGLVRQTHPEAQLLAVGSPRYGSNVADDYSTAVQAEAAAALGDHACFTGFVPPARMPEFYLAGDLFICASQWQEPLARVHYEAMAAGLPIVTTDRGGNAEIMEEGGNGLIARPHDDPAALAAQIRRLLDHADLREHLGRRGRMLAEERYTWRRVAAELLDVFEGVGEWHGSW